MAEFLPASPPLCLIECIRQIVVKVQPPNVPIVQLLIEQHVKHVQPQTWSPVCRSVKKDALMNFADLILTLFEACSVSTAFKKKIKHPITLI